MALGDFEAGRRAQDVLRKPRPVAAVDSRAVRQGAMPDDEVSRLGLDRLDPSPVQRRRCVEVALFQRRLRPFYGFTVHPRNAVKSSLVDRGVRKAQDALDAELYRTLLEIYIPMQEGWPFPGGILWIDGRFHRGTIEAHPELPGLPQLAECAVDARALTIVPQRLVLMDVDHSVGRMRRPVPVVGVGRVHAEEPPDRVGRRA